MGLLGVEGGFGRVRGGDSEGEQNGLDASVGLEQNLLITLIPHNIKLLSPFLDSLQFLLLSSPLQITCYSTLGSLFHRKVKKHSEVNTEGKEHTL